MNPLLFIYIFTMVFCPKLFGQKPPDSAPPTAPAHNSLIYYPGSSFYKPVEKTLRLVPSKENQVVVGFAHDTDHTILFAVKIPQLLKDTLRINLRAMCSYIVIKDSNGRECVLENGELLITKNTARKIQMVADYQYRLSGKKKAL